jgi:hypothetical protein
MSYITPASDFIQERPEVESSRILSPQQLTQYELETLKEEHRRLHYFSDKTNEELMQTQEEELFFNLSLVNLFRNLSLTMIAIINELLEITQETQLNDIILIFVKKDRLIYIGLLLIMIAFALYVVDITS